MHEASLEVVAVAGTATVFDEGMAVVFNKDVAAVFDEVVGAVFVEDMGAVFVADNEAVPLPTIVVVAVAVGDEAEAMVTLAEEEAVMTLAEEEAVVMIAAADTDENLVGVEVVAEVPPGTVVIIVAVVVVGVDDGVDTDFFVAVGGIVDWQKLL